MLDTEILRWILAVLAVPVLALLIRHIIRRAKALDERIEEYHESEESRKQQGPVDPYADLADVFGEAAADKKSERKKKPSG